MQNKETLVLNGPLAPELCTAGEDTQMRAELPPLHTDLLTLHSPLWYLLCSFPMNCLGILVPEHPCAWFQALRSFILMNIILSGNWSSAEI